MGIRHISAHMAIYVNMRVATSDPPTAWLGNLYIYTRARGDMCMIRSRTNTHTITSHTHDRAGTYMYMRAATLGRGGREPHHAINMSIYLHARGDIWARRLRTTTD